MNKLLHKMIDVPAYIEAHEMLFASFSNHAGITLIIMFCSNSMPAVLKTKEGNIKKETIFIQMVTLTI